MTSGKPIHLVALIGAILLASCGRTGLDTPTGDEIGRGGQPNSSWEESGGQVAVSGGHVAAGGLTSTSWRFSGGTGQRTVGGTSGAGGRIGGAAGQLTSGGVIASGGRVGGAAGQRASGGVIATAGATATGGNVGGLAGQRASGGTVGAGGNAGGVSGRGGFGGTATAGMATAGTGGTVSGWAGTGNSGGHAAQAGSLSGGSAGASSTAGSAGEMIPLAKVKSLVAGGQHTCALLDTGKVRCWGTASTGALGYGNLEDIGDNETPASAGDVDLGGRATQVALGTGHSCAVLDTAEVRCWGNPQVGCLGYANDRIIGDDETPASLGVVDVGGQVTSIASRYVHTCALNDTGSLRCWGYNSAGQLGYANTEDIGDNEAPAVAGVVDVGGAVEQVAVGGLHTCVLLTGGAVKCWGLAYALGVQATENLGDNETPATVDAVDVGGPVKQLAAGHGHTCALLQNGAVRCWGAGTLGALGYGSTASIGDDELPATAGDVDVGGPVQQITAGYYHTCALLVGGAVRCWGLGSVGQLGYGNTENVGDDETAASVGDVDVGGAVTAITAGQSHTCALLTSGAVRCWGRGYGGRLGYANAFDIGDNETPASAGDVRVIQ